MQAQAQDPEFIEHIMRQIKRLPKRERPFMVWFTQRLIDCTIAKREGNLTTGDRKLLEHLHKVIDQSAS